MHLDDQTGNPGDGPAADAPADPKDHAGAARIGPEDQTGDPAEPAGDTPAGPKDYAGAAPDAPEDQAGDPADGLAGDAPVRPLWIPDGVDFDSLPPQLRLALAEVIDPVYDELVLGAHGALERVAGLAVCHLAWIEVLTQLELGGALAAALARGEGVAACQDFVNRAVRTAMARDRLTHSLLRVSAFRERHLG